MRQSGQALPTTLRFFLLLLGCGVVGVAPARAQPLGPAGTGGLAAVDHLLARASTDARALLIAAHPDDEDTELLTLLARGLGAEAAYLSLSRGEGGQNLIGPELGEDLGLLRSGELATARATDGARQFFTRAFDFGFSKSLGEAERFWPPDSILADAIRVARRVRPQIIIAVFSGTPRDGHGQHQLSGVIARRLFAALRDSAWGPVRLYRTTRFDTAGTTLQLPTGALDRFAGQSLYQIAMRSRSFHRSQDFGVLQRLGASLARVALEDSVPARFERSLAAAGDGAATLFAGAGAALPPGLEHYAILVDSARALLGPRRSAEVTALIARALGALRRAGSAAFRAAKEPLLEEALVAAAGVVVDATANDERIVGGRPVEVRVAVWSADGARAEVGAVRLAGPEGWAIRDDGAAAAPDGGGAGFFRTEPVPQYRFTVTAPLDAPASTPYFLAQPRIGALYDWSAAPDSLRGTPFDPPLVQAIVELQVAGVPVRVRRAVAYRFADQARGEVRRPLVVVPEVAVRLEPATLVWPIGRRDPLEFVVELTHGGGGRTAGMVALELPGGWTATAPQPFALDGDGSRRSFRFTVRAPRSLTPGAVTVRAVATVEGRRFTTGTVPVAYAHIRPVQRAAAAEARVEALRLAPPLARRIGYVRGAADLIPEALAAAGITVQLLGPTDLERGDLGGFDVIVVGPRAYETDPALVANNARLLEWARAGGRLIVQYQQYQFVRGGFAPFALTIAQPHDRVTDETAPVRALVPRHPLFTTPNRLAPGDWDGWVQERGLYFARDWDAAYQPLLESGDAGEMLRGGLLVARTGRGLYVYTGLAFFRQLPAGVPGALRLFVNLLSMTE